jgi:spermidine/putrescine transport system permease protein
MHVSKSAQLASDHKQRHERRQLALLLGPAFTWLLVFFMLPLVMILVYSFLKRGTYGGVEVEFNLANYIKLLDTDYYLIFQRSLWLSLITTIACLVAGYPMAYFIARQSPRVRNLLVLAVIIPFWTNFLVRTYAIMVLLRDNGVINNVLLAAGIIKEPLDLLFTPFAVLIGEIYGFLPFMVLPIYASLEKFDYSLMEAAHDSGANDFWAFLRVMVPLTMPGIVAGCILVFIPAIGAFITPDILGGSKVMMIGNLIDRQFKAARNWPLASSISITLMFMVTVATFIYFRISGESDRTI